MVLLHIRACHELSRTGSDRSRDITTKTHRSIAFNRQPKSIRTISSYAHFLAALVQQHAVRRRNLSPDNHALAARSLSGPV